MIDRVRKLIFIHIARTGGTSIETALMGKDWWYIDSRTKHISAGHAREIYGEEVWSSFRKFTIVRNPWDRIVSMWSTKAWHQSSELDERCPLEEFIRRMKPHPHEIYNSLHYHEILDEEMDFVLRFETLQDDFTRMLNSIGIGGIVLPHTEYRVHEHYTKMYGESETRLVAELFKIDIDKYNYSFE